MVQVTVRGLGQAQNFMLKVDRNLRTSINREKINFLKKVRKSAKLRAPTWKGNLKDSIKIKRRGKSDHRLVVQSPYAVFQELGFSPHWVHRDMRTRSGGTIGQWMGGTPNDFIKVERSKPFIAPALQSQLPRMPTRLDIAVNKAFKMSGG